MTAFLVGSLIGLVLGLTGAGGSILAIPLLVFVLKLPMVDAVGLSLMTVMASALYGVIQRIRRNDIAWTPALIFAAGGAVTTPAGLYLAHQVSENLLLSIFILLMWIVAARMFWQTLHDPESSIPVRAAPAITDNKKSDPVCRLSNGGKLIASWRCRLTLIILGAFTGILSGLFGVGGGFLIVPSLVFFTQLSMYQAVGTSLAVIVIISTSGIISFMANTATALPHWLIFSLIIGAVAGMNLGTFLSRYLAGPRLQQIFSSVIILMSVLIGFKLHF